jgi:hypothetical protein
MSSINPVTYDQLPVATSLQSGDQLFMIRSGEFHRFNNNLIQRAITGAASTITVDNLTPDTAVFSNAQGKIQASEITGTELRRLKDVRENIQPQIDGILTDVANIQEELSTKVIIRETAWTTIPIIGSTQGTPPLRFRRTNSGDIQFFGIISINNVDANSSSIINNYQGLGIANATFEQLVPYFNSEQPGSAADSGVLRFRVVITNNLASLIFTGIGDAISTPITININASFPIILSA